MRSVAGRPAVSWGLHPSWTRCVSILLSAAPSVPLEKAWKQWSIDQIAPKYDAQIWTLQLPPGAAMSAGIDWRAGPEPVLPPLPSGHTLSFDEDASRGLGGKVWRGSGAMIRWLRANAASVRGTRVLELGAGTGISGLYAAGLGATSVLLTDGGSDELLEQLRHNAQQNQRLLLAQGCASVGVERLLFGSEKLPEGPFDLVIGSDVTYSVHEDRDALCSTISHFLQRGARCVLAHEHRRSDMFDLETVLNNQPTRDWRQNDVALNMFLEATLEHGLFARPLVFESGARKQEGETLLMSTDMSVFEVVQAV